MEKSSGSVSKKSSKDSYIESYAIDIDFTGTERALDSIEGGIYVKAGEEILYMGKTISCSTRMPNV